MVDAIGLAKLKVGGAEQIGLLLVPEEGVIGGLVGEEGAKHELCAGGGAGGASGEAIHRGFRYGEGVVVKGGVEGVLEPRAGGGGGGEKGVVGQVVGAFGQGATGER